MRSGYTGIYGLSWVMCTWRGPCGFLDPWEHVLAVGLGAAFGNAMAKWEVHLQEELDKRLQEVQSANKKRFIGAVFFSLFMFLFASPFH